MNWKNSFNLTNMALLLICLSCWGYNQSILNLNPFWNLQLTEWFQFTLILLISTKYFPQPSLKMIVVFYVLSRFILFQGLPLIEDDYYRYLWDGRLVAEGINPYLLPPSDIFWQNVPSLWRQHINYADVTTIYPPLTQLYFAAVYWLFGESLFGLRLGCLLFELATGLLIYKVLEKKGLPLKSLAVFLFFPTLLKENINSVHFDLLAAFFLFLFYFLLEFGQPNLKKTLLTWSALAFAVLVKIFPLLFLPLAFFHSKKRFWGFVAFTFWIVLAFYPFIDNDLHVFGGSSTFAKDWVFFESLPYYVQNLFAVLSTSIDIQSPLIKTAIESGKLTRLVLAGILFIISIAIGASKKVRLENKFIVLALFLFCFTTVLNSWYWLWILPFLVLYARRWVWFFPLYTTLGYSWFVDQDLYRWLHQPIYGFFILAAIVTILKTDSTSAPTVHSMK